MSIDSCNIMNNKYLEDTSISIEITRPITNYSDTKNNMRRDTDLFDKLLINLESVLVKDIIVSTAYVNNQKSINTDRLSRI